MKRKNLLLLLLVAFMTCGTSVLLSSCSDNDDSNSSQPAETDNYEIEVEPGLTMNENQFQTRVPATTDCDPAVIAALQAIDKVTDVKAYKQAVFSGQKLRYVKKTAYFFNYKQDIDHNNPSKGWFKQQCVLSVAGKERPTVLHSEGYSLGSNNPATNFNRLDSIREPQIVELLNANCLYVEHRYFGWSLPEGWTNKWNYLSAKQQSDDLHAIVTTIKQSGIISTSSKWLSTGGSKGGETTAYYAYHYPKDMDAYVPFAAPFLFSLSDTRPSTYMQQEGIIGDNMPKVKAAFRAFFSNKQLQQETAALLERNNPKVTNEYSGDELRYYLMKIMYDYHFDKMSLVPYNMWMPLVPKEGDSAEKFYQYIMANSETLLQTVESYGNYDGEQLSRIRKRLTRATTKAVRFNPYYIQSAKELGYLGTDLTWVEDLLTPEEIAALSASSCIPATYGVTYDGGTFIHQFLAGMRQSDCYIFFVYGMQDPWTGGRISEEYLGRNSLIHFITNGLHNDFIYNWNEYDRNLLLNWLKDRGF